MPSRIANESEHRRGLVLGLTLAEVLILLLFLILLALGARLIKVESALKEMNPLLTELRNHGELGVFDARKLVVELARVKELEKSVIEVKEDNSRLRVELVDKTKKLGAFEKIIAAAAVVNPSDPPALLKFALDVFEVVEIKVDLEQWKFLSELSSKLDKATKSMTAPEREQLRNAVIATVISNGGGATGHTWPPIIMLSEAKDYSFASGKAELTTKFVKLLQDDAIPTLLNITRDYPVVDVIEVVGHTDEQPIAARPSNLDNELLPVLRSDKEINTLIPADNAGLGLLRAVAVVGALKKDQRLAKYKILPLSGGQLIQIDHSLSQGTDTGNVKERRRIEIRLRGSK